MIILKNIEKMPESCRECPYSIYYGSISVCVLLGDEEDIHEAFVNCLKYEDCPLGEIEDPCY